LGLPEEMGSCHKEKQEFSHIVRKVLVGLLGHGLLPYKNHLPPILVIN